MKVYGWSLAGTVVALSSWLSATPSELVLHDGEVIRGENLAAAWEVRATHVATATCSPPRRGSRVGGTAPRSSAWTGLSAARHGNDRQRGAGCGVQ